MNNLRVFWMNIFFERIFLLQKKQCHKSRRSWSCPAGRPTSLIGGGRRVAWRDPDWRGEGNLNLRRRWCSAWRGSGAREERDSWWEGSKPLRGAVLKTISEKSDNQFVLLFYVRPFIFLLFWETFTFSKSGWKWNTTKIFSRLEHVIRAGCRNM